MGDLEDENYLSDEGPERDLEALTGGIEFTPDSAVAPEITYSAKVLLSQMTGKLQRLTMVRQLKRILTKRPETRTPQDVDSLVEQTKHIPLFQGLTLQQHRELCHVMSYRRTKEKELLTENGFLTSFFYVLTGCITATFATATPSLTCLDDASTSRQSTLMHNKSKALGFTPPTEDERREELKHWFEDMDLDHSGSISRSELSTFLRTIQIHISEEELTEMMRQADSDNSGFIDLEEFHFVMEEGLGMNAWWAQLQHRKELKVVFSVVDKDGSGSIDADELKGALRWAGAKMPNADFDQMFAEADDDGSGCIDFEEFAQIVDVSLEQPPTKIMKDGACICQLYSGCSVGEDAVLRPTWMRKGRSPPALRDRFAKRRLVIEAHHGSPSPSAAIELRSPKGLPDGFRSYLSNSSLDSMPVLSRRSKPIMDNATEGQAASDPFGREGSPEHGRQGDARLAAEESPTTSERGSAGIGAGDTPSSPVRRLSSSQSTWGGSSLTARTPSRRLSRTGALGHSQTPQGEEGDATARRPHLSQSMTSRSPIIRSFSEMGQRLNRLESTRAASRASTRASITARFEKEWDDSAPQRVRTRHENLTERSRLEALAVPRPHSTIVSDLTNLIRDSSFQQVPDMFQRPNHPSKIENKQRPMPLSARIPPISKGICLRANGSSPSPSRSRVHMGKANKASHTMKSLWLMESAPNKCSWDSYKMPASMQNSAEVTWQL
ncbi:hypothetical protein CYMTET_12214 [Cymbomonas tetramitiformis]|uniref:EF-hand domain-containing protein n=1 Tax=Cymbomonas tetramitiformis TaxID=36881 RepID=A0AAE0LCA6_9CHLO|nr:hypothetical protein CYMTET_12214 [Cymbomonas tetramitiformis]